MGTWEMEVNPRDEGRQGRFLLLSMTATLLARSGNSDHTVAHVCWVQSKAGLLAGTLLLKAAHCRKNGGVVFIKALLFSLHLTCTSLHGMSLA